MEGLGRVGDWKTGRVASAKPGLLAAQCVSLLLAWVTAGNGKDTLEKGVE